MLNRRMPDTSRPFNFLLTGVVLTLATSWTWPAIGETVEEIIVTHDLTLKKDSRLTQRLIVRADHVTIDGNGATLMGQGIPGDPKSMEEAGTGILIESATG